MSANNNSFAMPENALPRAFSVLVGLTSLAVLVQAVTAGIFVGHDGDDGWVTVHGVIADVTWVTALVTAVVGYRSVRRRHHRLWLGSVALFVLALAQTGVGHLITDAGMDSLVVVHVPLAMVIFGVTIWLAVATRHFRRLADLPSPYGDAERPRGRQHLPVSYRG